MVYPLRHLPGLIIPVIDAHRRHFYTAIYQGETRRSPYLDADAEEIARHIAVPDVALTLTGPDAPLLRDQWEMTLPANIKAQLRVEASYGRARALLERGAAFLSTHPGTPEDAPLYLRASDAERSLREHKENKSFANS